MLALFRLKSVRAVLCRHAFPALATTALLSLFASGRAAAEIQTRDVAPFESVEIGGSWIVEVTVGKDQSVSLEGDSDVLKHVTTEVRDNKLYVGVERDFWHSFRGSDERMKARISLPRLTGLAVDGAGHASVVGLDGGTTAVAINGSWDFDARGRVDKLPLVINGAGRADLPDLAVGDAAITINGSGDVLVQAQQSLAARINGSGRVRYAGAPSKVTSSVHGSGSVEQR